MYLQLKYVACINCTIKQWVHRRQSLRIVTGCLISATLFVLVGPRIPDQIGIQKCFFFFSCGGSKTGEPAEKTLEARTRINHKLSPHMTLGLGIEPGSHWQLLVGSECSDKSAILPWSQRFFLIFLRMRELRESREAVKTRVAKRRERKTSGYFGLESHFHADARVRI